MSSSHQEGQHGHHPTFGQYVLIATILFVITIVEFVLIWERAKIVEYLGPSKIPLLIFLSAIKFAIVIAYYMHLKFDHRLLTQVFLAGLFLSFGVAIAVLSLFASLGGEPRAYALERAVPYIGHGEGQTAHAPTVHTPAAAVAPTQVAPPATPTPPGSQAEASSQAKESVSQPTSLDGQAVFTGGGGCAACHAIEGISTGAVGPDLTHLATDAATRKPGMSAEAYIEESIRAPEAFVAPGGIPGIMTAALTGGLSDDEVAALVDFLMAQK